MSMEKYLKDVHINQSPIGITGLADWLETNKINDFPSIVMIFNGDGICEFVVSRYAPFDYERKNFVDDADEYQFGEGRYYSRKLCQFDYELIMSLHDQWYRITANGKIYDPMKYVVKGNTANVKTFVKYCCMELPVPNGYYRLLRAFSNCRQNDRDYKVLEESISKYEKLCLR